MIRVIPTHEQKLIRAHQVITSPATCLKIILDAIRDVGVTILRIEGELAEGFFTLTSPNIRISKHEFDSIQQSISCLSDVACISLTSCVAYQRSLQYWSSNGSAPHNSCIEGLGIAVSELFNKIPVRKLNRGSLINEENLIHAIRVYSVMNLSVDVSYRVGDSSGRVQPTQDLLSSVSSIFKIPLADLLLVHVDEHGLTGLVVKMAKRDKTQAKSILVLNNIELDDDKEIKGALNLDNTIVALLEGQLHKSENKTEVRSTRKPLGMSRKSNLVEASNATITKVFSAGQMPIPNTKEPFICANLEQGDLVNVFGNFNQEFIVVKRYNGLVLIDQHAAHERVRLEEFVDSLHSGCLTIPIQTKINVKSGHEKLKRLGFILDGNEITEIPSALKGSDDQLRSAVSEIEDLMNSLPIPDSIMDLLKTKACRGAIMFGDRLSKDQCVSLIQRLSKCKYPGICAHGRPSIMFRPFR